jgi:periplasmic protein TonB
MEVRKSPKADLERKRFVFLEIGLIVALGLIFLAFNWKSYEKTRENLTSRVVINEPEEMIPITEQQPPEPPKVEIPKLSTLIKIVEDNVEVEDDFKIDAEADDNTEIPDQMPLPVQKEEEPEAEQEIFLVVESPPAYPGGDKSMYEYLANNLKYPLQAKEANISGKVFLTFVVERDGSITDVKLLRGIGGGCDEEAIRVVSNMPQWTPGKQRGKPVRVQFNLPINFILQ